MWAAYWKKPDGTVRCLGRRFKTERQATNYLSRPRVGGHGQMWVQDANEDPCPPDPIIIRPSK